MSKLCFPLCILLIAVFSVIPGLASSEGRCGDGICDDSEIRNRDLCPRDCTGRSGKKQCVSENAMCGGIAGIVCCSGLSCVQTGNHPDASGICKPERLPAGSLYPMTVEELIPQGDLEAFAALLGSKNHGKRERAFQAFLAAGKAGIPHLLKVIDGQDKEAKYPAIGLLGELKAAEAVPRLLAELKSSDNMIRMQSAFALGKTGDERAVLPLISLAQSEKDPAQGPAIMGLGFSKDSRAIPCLRKLLSHDDPYLRVAAATALALFGRSDGFEQALAGTESTNNSARLVAIKALGIIGDKRVIGKLEAIVNDPKAFGRTDATISLKKIEYANALPEVKISVLRSCLDHNNEKVVRWAIDALAGNGTPEAVALLQEKAKSFSEEGLQARLKLKMMGK